MSVKEEPLSGYLVNWSSSAVLVAALGLEVEGAAAAAVILGGERLVVVMGQLIITPRKR